MHIRLFQALQGLSSWTGLQIKMILQRTCLARWNRYKWCLYFILVLSNHHINCLLCIVQVELIVLLLLLNRVKIITAFSCIFAFFCVSGLIIASLQVFVWVMTRSSSKLLRLKSNFLLSLDLSRHVIHGQVVCFLFWFCWSCHVFKKQHLWIKLSFFRKTFVQKICFSIVLLLQFTFDALVLNVLKLTFSLRKCCTLSWNRLIHLAFLSMILAVGDITRDVSRLWERIR